MSNTVFLLKKGFNKEDIPKSTIHLMVSHNYDKFLNDIPNTINELTIFTTNKLFYCNMPNGIKIININLVTLRDYNIILDNLPISLEKIRVNDYSKYNEELVDLLDTE